MKYQLQSTLTFNRWLSEIDVETKRRILARLARVKNGHFGDFKQIDVNLYELRFFFGGGLRVYYTIRDKQIVLLLAGGTKSTQYKDIEFARELLKQKE